MNSKAFLIACILLATIVFSPPSTCTARELAERDPIPTYKPAGCPNPYKRNCGRP
ncbi:hypothetical protein POPTR_017G110900v4 [Populus trichocarpa]|uniref:Uncharacterized protein n=1 Tax=Populus trichocarpa TaxID=3694 RepID=A0A2K1X6D4_POPTR|nr:hypothetical protein POPTR_017G110900v4 [Populus trichocarpa]